MRKFKFVVESKVVVTASSKDVLSAKRNLQENLQYLAPDLLSGCVISDGEEMETEEIYRGCNQPISKCTKQFRLCRGELER